MLVTYILGFCEAFSELRDKMKGKKKENEKLYKQNEDDSYNRFSSFDCFCYVNGNVSSASHSPNESAR